MYGTYAGINGAADSVKRLQVKNRVKSTWNCFACVACVDASDVRRILSRNPNWCIAIITAGTCRVIGVVTLSRICLHCSYAFASTLTGVKAYIMQSPKPEAATADWIEAASTKWITAGGARAYTCVCLHLVVLFFLKDFMSWIFLGFQHALHTHTRNKHIHVWQIHT